MNSSLALTGAIVGYTIGNDMSSHGIEGESPLYLPQAKVYDGSCGGVFLMTGTGIVPGDDFTLGTSASLSEIVLGVSGMWRPGSRSDATKKLQRFLV